MQLASTHQTWAASKNLAAIDDSCRIVHLFGSKLLQASSDAGAMPAGLWQLQLRMLCCKCYIANARAANYENLSVEKPTLLVRWYILLFINMHALPYPHIFLPCIALQDSRLLSPREWADQYS